MSFAGTLLSRGKVNWSHARWAQSGGMWGYWAALRPGNQRNVPIADMDGRAGWSGVWTE